jgi:hypothetical protein
MRQLLDFLTYIVTHVVERVSYDVVYKILEPVVPREHQETARLASTVIAVILSLVTCVLCAIASGALTEPAGR